MNKLKSIIKKLLNLLSSILIIILVVYIVLVGYQKIFNKNNLLKIGNYYIFQIISGSMEENLFVNDYIIIKEADSYKVGDIITYKEEQHYVTHRIVEINDEKIITKGDANNTKDDPIKQEDIIGKYIFKSNFLTFIFEYRYMLLLVILEIIILNNIFSKGDSEET